MIRKFKFRAWHEHTQRMSYENSYIPSSDIAPFPHIWMQYVELKDNNGKEIYEGDIIDIKSDISFNYTAVLVFWKGSYLLLNIEDYLIGKDGCDLPGRFLTLIQRDDWTLEVKGNIYQNPELLKLHKPKVNSHTEVKSADSSHD